MEQPLVLVTARSFGRADDAALRELRDAACRVERVTPEELPERIRGADAVIAGLEPYSAELIARAEKLKVISRYGVGCDAIDLLAARTRGIAVTNTPGANNESVSDLAFALMITVARGISAMDRAMKAGVPVRPLGVELWGKTVGIVGVGAIGRGLARRCRGFDMRVLANDLTEDEVFATSTPAKFVDLDTLLRESDFVSLHLPLMPATRHLISTRELNLMKNDSVLINTARGGIVDEEALYDCLMRGGLWGAGLDVLESDPAMHSSLVGLANCVVTPHAGATTRESSSRTSLMAARNALEVLQTGRSVLDVTRLTSL